MTAASVRWAFTVALLAGALSACATVPQAREIAVTPDNFNGVVLVSDGRSRAGIQTNGFADLETKAALDDRTRFQIGSISKFLTTLAVLRLADAGTLSLDDKVGRWVDGLPDDTAQNVTLRHLLANTSGIPDGATAALKKDPTVLTSKDSARDAGVRFGQGALKFRPGNGWDYAVINWILMRAVIESATRKSFEAVVQEALVRPLRLENTGIPVASFPERAGDAANHASSPPHAVKPNVIPAFAAAAGSFYSSAYDLHRIIRGVFSSRFLSPKARDELQSVHWAPENYALGGRVIRKDPDRCTVLWETGKTSNYVSLLAFRPADRRVVVILSNNGQPQTAISQMGEKLLATPVCEN